MEKSLEGSLYKRLLLLKPLRTHLYSNKLESGLQVGLERGYRGLFFAPNCVLLYNGVNINRFYSEKQKDKLELISIGSLFENKNHLLLIKTVQILVYKHCDVHLSILGEGPLRVTLQNQIKELLLIKLKIML